MNVREGHEEDEGNSDEEGYAQGLRLLTPRRNTPTTCEFPPSCVCVCYLDSFIVASPRRMMHGRAVITAHVQVRFGFMEEPHRVNVSITASVHQRCFAMLIQGIQVRPELTQHLHMVDMT